MKTRWRIGWAVMTLALLSSGCATPSAQDGFAGVQSMVHDRTGQTLHWNRQSPADAQADQAVRRLLAAPLTAESAAQIALLNNAGLQATYEDLGIAQADLVQAGLLKNPVFMVSPRFPNVPPSATDLTLQVTEDFLSILSLPLRRKVAAAQFEAAKLEVAQAALEMADDTRAACLSVQADQEVLKLCEDIQEAADAAGQTARQMHEAGNLSDLDLDSHLEQGEQAGLDLAEAKEKLADDRRTLSALMGLWGPWTNWTIAPFADDKIPDGEPDAIQLQRLALRQRVDLAMARQEVAIVARSIGAATPFGPDDEIDVGANGERQTSGQWIVGPTVTLPIPLLDQGQAAGNRSEAQLWAAREKYLALAIEIRGQVRGAVDHLAGAQARAKLYRDQILPRRARIVQETIHRSNGMLSGVFDVLAARTDELAARRREVEARCDYWLAWIELERAVGGRAN